MLIFNKLTVQNFMSYGNVPTTINFNSPGTNLVVSENLDDTTNGVSSNGGGKTSLTLHALTYVLYENVVSKIKIDNLINNINKKNMYVSVEFTKGNTEYHITRARKGKGGGKAVKAIEILINGEDKTPDSIDNANKLIEQIIGMPYDLFIRIVTFSANSISFLELPSRHASQVNQTDLIEELFNLKLLSEKADILKQKIAQTDKSIELNTVRIDQLKKEHQRHREQVVSAEQRVRVWDQQKQHDIELLQRNVATFKAIDLVEQQSLLQQLNAVKNDIRQKQASFKELQTILSSKQLVANSQVAQEKAEQSAKKSESQTLQSQLNTFKQQLVDCHKIMKRLQDEKQQLIDHKCPYCTQPFKDAASKVVDVEKNITELDHKTLDLAASIEQKTIDISNKQKEIDIISERLRVTQTKIELELQTDKRLIHASQNEINNLGNMGSNIATQLEVENIEELHEISKQISVLEDKIAVLQQTANPHLDALADLNNIQLEKIDSSIIDDLTTLVSHEKFLLKLLTKKDSFIRKALLDKQIPFLNSRLKYYLREMQLPHVVEFMPDMTASITQFDRPLDFGNLSNGQKARVNIALSFAFRDVLQVLHQKVNICILDEVLDHGLDSPGIQAASRMLKQKARQEQLSLFIISHRDEVNGSAFDRKLIVQMSNGFSTLISSDNLVNSGHK